MEKTPSESIEESSKAVQDAINEVADSLPASVAKNLKTAAAAASLAASFKKYLQENPDKVDQLAEILSQEKGTK